jgi:hypothetical protein
MSDPSFSQPERSNFLIPILVVVAIVVAVFLSIHFFAETRAADGSVAKVAIYAQKTSYAATAASYPNGTHVVGLTDPSEDDLYVLATVRVHDDDSKLPLFIKDFTGTLTTQDGVDITTSAMEKNDLDSVYMAFPSLKTMSGPPLLREIEIAPGASAEGMVMLHYSATEATWKARKSASVTVEFYHQAPLTLPIPE